MSIVSSQRCTHNSDGKDILLNESFSNVYK